ncbi:MerR family transcriptional regulator [Paenibacillus sonchi]|uniref:MerR family transcriptional regulator n=4 Tax=Paenibacillus sonchi group TaxID=2044880 RepID=A0A974PI58_9BACL|nr:MULTISPECIES: MerR family transcriptional regulator [Paenibacillus sonchi group]KWX76805.1 transcriptional regulator [Paenibacillus riograndensis]KWX88851.1 transcriptional regulator [Paenibacillus riograndensis]MCE3200307.1 MerR family transcriptional regulator [Paenibacillus sonchi]QQZ64261.1 MerR family transcriptional regulator [Paenibacillus sonchi]CQR54966.1 transcriptional regulator cueR [Paenibacillus riograndensis SBR5]
MTLYRIGELAKAAHTSERTIDYYTKLGLIAPESRSVKNYRLYSHETLVALERINQLKQEKYTLDEIKSMMSKWNAATSENDVSDRLAELELQMQRLEREVKALEPVISGLKPVQARRALAALLPQGVACMEAIKLLLTQGPPM